MTIIPNCITCAARLTGRQKLFCSIACKNKQHQSYDAQKSRGLERKLALLDRYGNKCSRCGYARNLAAFVFHHQNPEQKEFKLDVRSLSNRTWQLILAEVEKCALLCANCHAEIHNPLLDLERLR